MAPDDIVGTQTWTEQILGAITDSRAMIVLISAASNASPHVSREVNLALGKGRAVLPIRIADVPPQGSLEYLLSLVQRVDAFPPPITDHSDRVMRRLESIVTTAARTSGPSPAPVAAVSPSPGTSLRPATPPAPPAATPSATPLAPPAAAPAATPPATTQGAARNPFAQRTAVLIGGAIGIVVIALLGAALVFKSPGPTPIPTLAAASSQAPVPTAGSPGGTFEATPAATGGLLSADEQTAQARLPVVDPGTTGCKPWIAAPGGEDVLSPSGYATALARITCPGPNPGGPQARYALYQSKDALDADYAAIMTGQGVAQGSACATAIPANAAWNYPGYPASGNLACYARDGGVQYVWSDHDLLILAQWLAPDNAKGLAFWQLWERSRNPAETALLNALPASAVASGPCIRAADDYYPSALAIVSCPRPTGQNAVFYASFPSADAFPNDPMTVLFFSIMTEGGVAADTSTGCYESSSGRYTWGFKDNGVVGPSQGYLGCYQRTDTEPATTQIVWTFNRTAVMGLWDGPDVDTATKLFDGWITEVK
jgi:hypothetical protein